MNLAILMLRLRDRSPSGPAATLAELAVDDLLDRSLANLMDPALLATLIHERVPALLASPGAARADETRLEAALAWLESHPGPLGEHLPAEAKRSLRSLARRPFTPDREMVSQLLNRPAVKRLVRDSVMDLLVSFGKRIAAPASDSRVARGLGDLSRFAAGALGALAGNVAGALSEEFGRQIERLADQSADAAVARSIEKLVEGLTDPSRVAEGAALREALLDGVLEVKGKDLAALLRRNDLGPAARDLREALAALLASSNGRALVSEGLRDLLARRGSETLREILEKFELLEILRPIAVDAARGWLSPLVGGEAFAAWLIAVAADPPGA